MNFSIQRSRQALQKLEVFQTTVKSDWARDYWQRQIDKLKSKITKHDAIYSIR